jgi:outer membrane protein OmpA-like peptidoglycan-associated protein
MKQSRRLLKQKRRRKNREESLAIHVPVSSSARTLKQIPEHLAASPIGQKAVLRAQRQQGNAIVGKHLGLAATQVDPLSKFVSNSNAITKMLTSHTADVQRDCPPDCPREPKRRIPAIPDEVVIKVEDAIDISDYQEAINLIVSELNQKGRIVTSYIEDGIMTYDSGLNDEGLTTSYWDKDPLKHPDAKMLPFKVTIGPPAFSSAPWLYATIIHEWRHVQQFRVPQSMADRYAAIEVDAYLNSIEQAWSSGLTTEEVQELWERLKDDHWSSITDADIKESLRPRFDAAQAYVNSLLTSDLAPRAYQPLSFGQIFFTTGSADLNSTANDEVGRLASEVHTFQGNHPDYDLRFTLTGFASPRWKHPRRGEMPAELNQVLSQRRAENTLSTLQNAIHAEGDGACDFRIQTCPPQVTTVDDSTWDSLTTGRGSEPALAEGRDLTSDDQGDRRVDIQVTFSPGPQVTTQPPPFLGGGGS